MTTTSDDRISRIRSTEYFDGGGRIVMVYDSENAGAWIRSSLTYPVDC
ncbi:hypothetical protein [Haladaptatus sp. NG-SE-30]